MISSHIECGVGIGGLVQAQIASTVKPDALRLLTGSGEFEQISVPRNAVNESDFAKKR